MLDANLDAQNRRGAIACLAGQRAHESAISLTPRRAWCRRLHLWNPSVSASSACANFGPRGERCSRNYAGWGVPRPHDPGRATWGGPTSNASEDRGDGGAEVGWLALGIGDAPDTDAVRTRCAALRAELGALDEGRRGDRRRRGGARDAGTDPRRHLRRCLVRAPSATSRGLAARDPRSPWTPGAAPPRARAARVRAALSVAATCAGLVRAGRRRCALTSSASQTRCSARGLAGASARSSGSAWLAGGGVVAVLAAGRVRVGRHAGGGGGACAGLRRTARASVTGRASHRRRAGDGAGSGTP